MDTTLFQIISELARLHNLAMAQEKQLNEAAEINAQLGDENARLTARVQELTLGMQSIEAKHEQKWGEREQLLNQLRAAMVEIGVPRGHANSWQRATTLMDKMVK